MQSSTKQYIFVTGACGAGKSTLAKALSHQLQLPLHRLDDDPDFRQMLPYEPELFGHIWRGGAPMTPGTPHGTTLAIRERLALRLPGRWCACTPTG